MADVMQSPGEKGVGVTKHAGDFSGSDFSRALREGLKVRRLGGSKGKRNVHLEN